MNKQELVENIADLAQLQKVVAERVLEAVCATIVTKLKSGELVRVKSFGKFKLSHRAAGEVHNPATGGKMSIGPSNGVRFTQSAVLKQALNTGAGRRR